MKAATLAASVLTALLCAAAPGGFAHTVQLSSSRLQVDARAASAQIELNGRDLQAALQVELTGPDGQVPPAALLLHDDLIRAYVLEHVKLTIAEGAECIGEVRRVAAKAEHVLVDVDWRCPPMNGTRAYRVTLFHAVDPAARHMVAASGALSRLALLSVTSPQVDLGRTRASAWEVVGHYVVAGIEHILIGYDHIAFVLAVILWGRKFWPLVGVVTAFTAAHSITLTLAVLGVVNLPGRVVELVIAASIVYAAAENFAVHDLRHRWLLAFVFGLVHGFGFAGALREYGIPRDALVPALAAFNIGVELGQMAVVILALGALWVMERALAAAVGQPVRAPDPRIVYAASGAVLLCGLYWTIQRALG